MTQINIVYDGLYDDVDIIEVPDCIVNRINSIAQEYLDWVPPEDDTEGWVIINGKKCLSKGAVGFVTWLNLVYCLSPKASIVSQNVSYCPLCPTVQF